MSSAILASNYRAMTVSGEQVSTFLRQAVVDFVWPKPLDYLILDMDPSTGDSMRSAHEMFKGKLEFVIISSSDVSSLSDCRRMVNACNEKKPPIEIIGIMANMVGSECPNCLQEIVCGHCGEHISFGNEEKVFMLAAEKRIRYLGAVKFNPAIKERTDHGNPILPNGSAIKNVVEMILLGDKK
jgi:Mrp family chromosome partitioning ATPase